MFLILFWGTSPLCLSVGTSYWVDYFIVRTDSQSYPVDVASPVTALAANASGTVFAAVDYQGFGFISRNSYSGSDIWQTGLGSISALTLDHSGNLYSLSGNGNVS